MSSISVIAHWELPAALKDPSAQKKIWVHWSHTAKAFGCTRIALVDVDGDCPTFGDNEIELSIHTDLQSAIEATTRDHIYVEQGGTSIDGFTHPDEATYIFGSNYGQLPRADISINSLGPLHDVISLGIVLGHRGLEWR